MNPPTDFEICEGYACFRPSGQVTFYEGVGLVAKALAEASEKGIQRLLLDTVNLRGFPHPTTVERYHMAEQWAASARGLRLSVLTRPDLVDPLRFGIMVARNRGLFVNVFTSEPEAVAWLLDPNAE